MNEFNQVAKAVEGFFRRNNIARIDIVSADLQEGGLRVEWKKAGRVQGEILTQFDEPARHVALAILRGQSAEPMQKFGEQMRSFQETRQQQSEIMLDL